MRRRLPLLCFVLLGLSMAPLALAKGTARKEKPKVAPALPSGAKAVPAGAPYERTDTVRVEINADGETVYSVSPSHFDVSPPLSELAKATRFEELWEFELLGNGTRVARSFTLHPRSLLAWP